MGCGALVERGREDLSQGIVMLRDTAEVGFSIFIIRLCTLTCKLKFEVVFCAFSACTCIFLAYASSTCVLVSRIISGHQLHGIYYIIDERLVIAASEPPRSCRSTC